MSEKGSPTADWLDLLGREDVVLAAERQPLAAIATWTLGKPCASCSARGWLHWGDTPHLTEPDTATGKRGHA